MGKSSVLFLSRATGDHVADLAPSEVASAPFIYIYFFVEYVTPRMILTFPLTCEMDFPPVANCDVLLISLRVKSWCLWLRHKMSSFSVGIQTVSSYQESALFSENSGACFNDILPRPSSCTPYSLPALTIFIKEREWVLDLSFWEYIVEIFRSGRSLKIHMTLAPILE